MTNRTDVTPTHGESYSNPDWPPQSPAQNQGYTTVTTNYNNAQRNSAVLPLVKNYPSFPAIAPTQKLQNPDTRRWLLQTMLPIVLVPLAVVTGIGYKLLQQQTEGQTSQQVKTLSLLASEGTTKVLTEAAQAPKTIAVNPWIIDAVRQSKQEVGAGAPNQLASNPPPLPLNPTLNAYLKSAATAIGVSELVLTESHGISLTSGKPGEKAQGRNQTGAQKPENLQQWTIESELNKATNSLNIGISQAIVDPESNEFLGTIQAVFPSSKVAQMSASVTQPNLKGSQQVQVLSTNAGRIIATITAQDSKASQEVVGGKAIEEIATALVNTAKNKVTAEQISKLKAQYSLQDLTVTQPGPAGGAVLTAVLTHEGKQFSLTTIPQTPWVAVASGNRSDGAVDTQFLLACGLLSLLLAGAAAVLILHLAKRLATPLRYLTSATEQCSLEELETALSHSTKEVETLAHALGGLVQRIKNFAQERTIAAEQSRLLSMITSTRTLTEQDVKKVFDHALAEARHILGVDRIVIYRFKPDWSGYISNEAVAAGWVQALHDEIGDPCIPQSILQEYQTERVAINEDVWNAGFHPDHLKLMERLQVRANLVTPILHEGQLFGLLIAHHCAKTHAWQETEISFMRQLAVQLGAMLDRRIFIQAREIEAERSQLLRDITQQLTQADTSEAVLAQLPLFHIRQLLKTDRILLFRFDANWKGTITAESVADPFPRALGAQIYDPCFATEYVEKYQRGRVQATSNIYEAGLTPCHLNQLEPFSVKANLVAPILQNGRLLGLLIAHQCSAPRTWEQVEIDLFAQVANQVALALDRCDLLEQRESAAKQAHLLAAEQRQQKELLQYQLVELLSQVEGAARGDLTVRAEVTAGEIGTVADFFNSIVESLGQIVTHVKHSVIQVSEALNTDQVEIGQLTDNVLKQAEETTRTLQSVEQMTRSIQAVADNAQRAAIVASNASTAVEAGETAMDLTVQNILGLREMIGDTAKKMKRLGESSQQISKVVSLIEKIALQTNLLSINAGIEAARAGQEGQGFSVVAEEIGELAVKSAAATSEIEEIVTTIQMETGQVIEAMEKSIVKVVEGTHLVEDTKQSLNQIMEVSQEIDQLVKSISTATVSQIQTSTVVSKLMQEVVQVSQLTSASSGKISQSLQQTAKIAQDLQASVGTFKVEAEV